MDCIIPSSDCKTKLSPSPVDLIILEVILTSPISANEVAVRIPETFKLSLNVPVFAVKLSKTKSSLMYKSPPI